jgi:hypothetical protein
MKGMYGNRIRKINPNTRHPNQPLLLAITLEWINKIILQLINLMG